jgi:Na+/melibiose symporter-like transporter
MQGNPKGPDGGQGGRALERREKEQDLSREATWKRRRAGIMMPMTMMMIVYDNHRDYIAQFFCRYCFPSRSLSYYYLLAILPSRNHHALLIKALIYAGKGGQLVAASHQKN